MDALLGNYNRAPVTFVRGEGCYLFDDQGRRYLDFIAGIAVCALGHSHPWIAQAVSEQARTLVHVSNLYYQEPAGTLARELVDRSGLARVFFCNSGTEANEAAIKLARKRAFRRDEKDRMTILACTGSFHGRTYGALAATDNAKYQEGFGPMPAGFAFTPFNDVAALEKNLDERVAAFIVEPVQGESGVHPATPEFLAAARRLCDARGALLIFDEIQCGMGRLGPLFAFQRFEVTPDVVTMAKALANGLPIGAMLVAECAADALRPGDHGSTFGGSPIPCAAALAHLRVRDAIDLASYVAVREVQLMARLTDLALAFPNAIDGMRGIGLLAALQLKEKYPVGDVVTALREAGVLVGSAGGNSLRFAPPLVIGEEGIDEAYDALYDVLAKLDERKEPILAG
ncbi:MAG TPA: aspartate aminotransferase family protein [Candidatus Baltobacteraceae bacterium]|nr:aspartate aminotransferase family protein [Candidatus Baltobacteraceae bacterium]